MNIRALPIVTFILRQRRRTLFAAAVALIAALLLGWQVALGIQRAIYPQNTSPTAPTAEGAKGNETLAPGAHHSRANDAAEPGAPGTAGKPVADPTHKAAATQNSNTQKAPTPLLPGTPGSPISVQALLRIPSSGTVLTLSGLNFNLYDSQPKKFQGIFSKPPYTIKKVEYPASFASDSITKGVAALNVQLRSNPGQKIVLAHSQGAQVASRWMREFANDATAPGSQEVTFILSGNPLRSTGGYIIGRPEVGGTTGQPTPTTTKWPIIDVARRYDGWADWVRDTNNKWAVDNANAGKNSFHSDYASVNIYASTHTIWKFGNTTYVLTKEDNLPLWNNNAEYPLGVRAAMRAHIENAYNRPTNDPRVILMPIETQEWKDTLTSWGVPH